jgi:hypothetical protein
MKSHQLLYIFCLLLLGSVFQACKETEPILFKTSDFVRFEEPTSSGLESEEIEIRVIRSTRDMSSDETISYTVSSKYVNTGANANATFTIPNQGQIVIPAGEVEKSITVVTLNDATNDGDREITLTLDFSSSSLTLGYPGEASRQKSHKITVFEDDCPLDLDQFTGTYSVTFTSLAFGATHSYDCSVTKGVGNSLIVSGPPVYDPGGFLGGIPEIASSTIIDIDPVAKTAVVRDDQFIYRNSAGAARFVGTYDLDPGKLLTCSNGFSVNFYVIRNTGTVFDIAENCRFTKK